MEYGVQICYRKKLNYIDEDRWFLISGTFFFEFGELRYVHYLYDYPLYDTVYGFEDVEGNGFWAAEERGNIFDIIRRRDGVVYEGGAGTGRRLVFSLGSDDSSQMRRGVADDDLGVLEDGDERAEDEIDYAVDLAHIEELVFGLC
nr:hypothetical protein Iba_chr03aCG7800 [Ipomoea batatas]